MRTCFVRVAEHSGRQAHQWQHASGDAWYAPRDAASIVTRRAFRHALATDFKSD
jgi:hypothetical protein